MSNGVMYITENNYWHTIDLDVDVFATEMQFHQLGSGTSIKLTYAGGDEDKDYSYAKLSSTGVTFYNSKNNPIDDISLLNFDISYMSEDSNSANETFLSRKNDKELSWNCYSILNLNCDSSNMQLLLENQSVTFLDVNSTGFGPVSDIYLLASDDVEVIGGSNIPVTVVNYNTGEYLPVSFAIFDIDGADKSVTAVSSDLNKVIKLESGGDKNSVEFEFKLPEGNYILNAELADEVKLMSIDLSTNGVDYIPLSSVVGDSRPYNSVGSHYLGLNLTDDGYTMRVTYTLKESDVTLGQYIQTKLTLHSPYKYNVSSYLEENKTLFEKTKKQLSDLDHGMFDYTYQVPKEDLIVNPLDASEFTNPNHAYNPFTICMWDVSTTHNGKDSISITNKIK
jgi:hypothetical protein